MTGAIAFDRLAGVTPATRARTGPGSSTRRANPLGCGDV